MDDLMVRLDRQLRYWTRSVVACDPQGDDSMRAELRQVLAEAAALKAQPFLVKSGDGVEQPTQPDVVAAAALPEWMHDPGKVAELLTHLEEAGWRPDSNGDPECVDQACAMAADVVRLVLMPMLIPDRCAASPSTADVAGARPALGGETGITNDPIAWISDESLRRLETGGNVRGSVPVHAGKSGVAKHPLYTRASTSSAESCRNQSLLLTKGHTTGQEKGT